MAFFTGDNSSLSINGKPVAGVKSIRVLTLEEITWQNFARDFVMPNEWTPTLEAFLAYMDIYLCVREAV